MSRIHVCLLMSFLIIGISSSSQAPLKLISHTIQLKENFSFNLKIPAGYKIAIAARGLKRPRFFAKSPDGKLFVTDMYNRDDNTNGKIYILDGWNDTTKRFERVITYLEGLRNPNQVAFFTSNNQSFIYIAETHQLSYYKYNAGTNKPEGPAKAIATFPDYGLNYKYGGWHLTRSIAFHNNKIYVSVGSSCDACIEKEEVRACIVEMDWMEVIREYTQEGCAIR